jgi:glutamyl-Q tRNA(Asp) synthetase
MTSQPVFRFAPSPNGHLHLGHALSALLNADMARKTGGRFLLRIEDIDPTRCKPEYEQSICEDLAWLGIQWEQPVRRQSEHLSEYADALGKLETDGLVYASFETRADLVRMITSRDPDGGVRFTRREGLSPDETAAREKRGEPYALRLDTHKAMARITKPLLWQEGDHQVEAHPEQWGDVILGRKETPASYHLSVVLDDALQGVTHIVRGMDLYESTSIHRLLQVILRLPAPLYDHHRLILDGSGRKLAKRDPSTTLRDLRKSGWTKDEVRKAVGLAHAESKHPHPEGKRDDAGHG